MTTYVRGEVLFHVHTEHTPSETQAYLLQFSVRAQQHPSFACTARAIASNVDRK
jgi:hypothetical protein